MKEPAAHSQPSLSQGGTARGIQRSGYLPTLDGWRALAIVAVILHHDVLHRIGTFSTQCVYQYGAYGVDVFFAISGLLICSRLLDEERISGSVHLQRFYVRRAFRIFPPALLYLIVLALMAKLSVIDISKREWLESLFFCRNYWTIFGGMKAGLAGWYTGHFWSLSLEEQFYLLFPAIIALASRKYRAGILAVLGLLIFAHRIVALHSRPWDHIEFHADVRIDALLVPALIAVLVSNAKTRDLFQRWLRLWPILVFATLCLIPFGQGKAWHISLLIVLMPCIVLGSVLNPTNIFGRALEWSWLRFIGRISYSLYLWQQLFFTGHFTLGGTLGPWQRWPLNMILTFACALASYYILERPMARLGHRWAPSASPGRDDLDPSSSRESVQHATPS